MNKGVVLLLLLSAGYLGLALFGKLKNFVDAYRESREVE